MQGYIAMGDKRLPESLLQGRVYDEYVPTERKAEFGSTSGSGFRIPEAMLVTLERPFHASIRTPSGSGLVFAFITFYESEIY